MQLPVIGFVGVQGAILFLVVLFLCIYGYYAGLNKSLTPLFVTIIAMSVAVIPQFHGWVSENISLIFAKHSRYAAYLLIFTVVFFVMRFAFSKLPRVVELGLPPKLDKFCGILGGLVMAFAACTMLLILIYGWRLPLDGLYTRSNIGAVVCKAWSQTAVLPELHSLLYKNPLSLF